MCGPADCEQPVLQELERRVCLLNLLLHKAYAAAGSSTSSFEVEAGPPFHLRPRTHCY